MTDDLQSIHHLKTDEETESLYILLSDTGTLFTKGVQQYTKAPYNHTSISFTENLDQMYSFGRKSPRNPIIGGFIKEDVYYGTYRYFPDTTCALYEMKVSKRSIEKVKRVIQQFENNKDSYTYNLIGLVGIPLNVPISVKSSYFCSQFVAEVLRRAGIFLWDKPSALVTPEDFRMCKGLVMIYEGLLYEYEPIRVRLPLYQLHKKQLFIRGRNFQRNKRNDLLQSYAMDRGSYLQGVIPFKSSLKMKYEQYRNYSIHENWLRTRKAKIEKLIYWFFGKG